MSDISDGRGRVASKVTAGLAALYFIKTSELGSTVTYDSSTGLVTDFAAMTAYRYALVSGTNIDDDSQSSSDTGAKFNSITGTVTLQGSLTTDQKEFDNLQAGEYSIVGELRTGAAKLFSPDTPIDITSLKILHGSAEGDLVGATMDLLGKSYSFSRNITGAARGLPFGGITTPANVTIVT